MRPAAAFLLCGAALAGGCCVNPFHHTESPGEEARPGDPDQAARRSIQPEQPAVQPAAGTGDPAGGFDIRLVRVQPGVHLGTVQPCDVIFSGRSEAVEGRDAQRYGTEVGQRMAIKCYASAGEAWADLVFARADAAQVAQVRRGRRVQVRILAPAGGYFDYPIVQFVAAEGDNPELARMAARPQPLNVPNGFALSALGDDPALLGTVQQCAIAFADEIQLVESNDRRRRSYPAGVQNRMTVRCKHAGGEEPADLVFMPSQALAALAVRRGEILPVRVISRNGGFTDHPILQLASQ